MKTLKTLIEAEKEKITSLLIAKYVSKKVYEKEVKKLEYEVGDIDRDELRDEIVKKRNRISEEGIDDDIKANIKKDLDELVETDNKCNELSEVLIGLEQTIRNIESDKLALQALDEVDEINKFIKDAK